MKISVAIFALAAVVTLQSCSRTETPKASDAIMSAYNAVNNKDTAAYLATLSSSARDIYRAAPKRLAADLAYWKANRFEVQILSESGDESDAAVAYRVKVTGANPEQSTPSVLVYKEDGHWRISTPTMYSAYERIPSPPQPGKPGENC